MTRTAVENTKHTEDTSPHRHAMHKQEKQPEEICPRKKLAESETRRDVS